MKALGIRANPAIFSALHAVSLKPLDYRHPDRLAEILDLFRSPDEADGESVD